MLEEKSLYSSEGFNYSDYNCRYLTGDDYLRIGRLIDAARKSNLQDPVIIKLRSANCPYEVQKVYSLSEENQKKIREFAAEQRKKESEFAPIKLPDEALFNDLDRFLELDGFIDFWIHDGGEIRGPSPSSQNPGWTTLGLK